MSVSIECDQDFTPGETPRVRVAVVPNGWCADMAIGMPGNRLDLMRKGERVGTLTVLSSHTSLPFSPESGVVIPPWLHLEGVAA